MGGSMRAKTNIIDLNGQGLLWADLGEPKRTRPTEAEIDEALSSNAKLAIKKWHRGKAPRICDFDLGIFKETVKEEAWKRLKNFTHGGKFTLHEYSYLACCFALRDIQRSSVSANRKQEAAGAADVPLLDMCEEAMA
jgi:hypothetical protein